MKFLSHLTLPGSSVFHFDRLDSEDTPSQTIISPDINFTKKQLMIQLMIDNDGAMGLKVYYGNYGDDDDDGSHIPFAALEASHHHHIFSFIPIVVKIILFSNIIA